MPRFAQMNEIQRTLRNKDVIRNVGIIAHIDHGKTTMIDSLLAGAGLLSLRVAGSARVLDYLEEEQKRGITIKTANISLLVHIRNNSFVINLVDTPGHVDFTGKVTRALRAVDGAIVIVDAVEGIMAQTETVTRQALNERVKPILFINKVDRLITELRLKQNEVQDRFEHIINEFNDLIEVHAEPVFKDKWKVKTEDESVGFGSALQKWGFTVNVVRKKKLRFVEIQKACEQRKDEGLSRLIPLHESIFEMILRALPDPLTSQKYRIPKIWKGDANSPLGQALIKCSDEGPAVMHVTGTQTISDNEMTAVGRVFSGTIRNNDRLFLVDVAREYEIHGVAIVMGAYREPVDQISAGSIGAVQGSAIVRAGYTLVDPGYSKGAIPFEQVKYLSEPAVTVAVEPRDPGKLEDLVEAVERLTEEDPNVRATVNRETGQYLISCLGELHLETTVKFIREYSKGIEIIVSDPTVEYRETVLRIGSTVMTKSPNKRNAFWIQVEPIESSTLDLIDQGELSGDTNLAQIQTALTEKAHYSGSQARRIWSVNDYRNVLLNQSDKAQTARDDIVAGFHWACSAGPLCEEPLRGINVKILDASISERSEERTRDQIGRAVSRAILGSCLTADPDLLEPIYRLEVTCPLQMLGNTARLIARRHGKIESTEDEGNLMRTEASIPLVDTFGLTAELYSATSGKAFWQLDFERWNHVAKENQLRIIAQQREIRGLPAQVPDPEKFVDKIIRKRH